MITVRFRYVTGLPRPLFTRPRLCGAWNGWVETPMSEDVGEDGCPEFTAEVTFADAQAGASLQWGVRADAPEGADVWAIGAESAATTDQNRVRTVVLPAAGETVEAVYYLSWGRRLGAQKVRRPDGDPGRPGLRFGVWSPNAAAVDVVFASPGRPYIADDGTGIDPAAPVVALTRGPDDIWTGVAPGDFADHLGAAYMLRITTADGEQLLRTDLASRWQAGRGSVDPADGGWDGTIATLEGTVGCSVVVDLDVVRAEFEPSSTPPRVVPETEFWSSEFTSEHPVPSRIEDLAIYELHVGALGFPSAGPGTLADALHLLDQLADLGVTAIELMPLAEFADDWDWGYGNTHHFAIQSSAGGRDKYKYFVRECHRRGIAVIQDVVYNHFDLDADRAEWQFDSKAPQDNVYYWYQGDPGDYPSPDGGYVDNGSSGFAPRFSAEPVRQTFVSSAVHLIEEFHVDGLRVDLTQAMHRDNRLHADGSPVPEANLFGQKLLRELASTLRLVRPQTILIAEDHTGWAAVTEPVEAGGLGFDSTWFAEFYHHLIGDDEAADGDARLLHEAGFGDDRPLNLDAFADRLRSTSARTVVYCKSHDEAGNAAGTARNVVDAVNGAVLLGETRAYAEARTRVVDGLTLLAAGTPMFFMAEEIAGRKPYLYDNVDEAKEDLIGDRTGIGANMFRFFCDLLALRRACSALRGDGLDVIHSYGPTRVLAFTRRDAGTDLLVVASLNNTAFPDGYDLATDPARLPDGGWQEIFNSDAATYGGQNLGNDGATLPAAGGHLQLRLPANGLIVLQRR